jgi:hypothetical protein
MPPSPATKFSPKRDNHKRGRSFESGVLVRDKDDDLALFNEVQTRETDNFLLQSNDDFEDTFSTKLKYFADQKLGISVPVRGETSDLLNADGEKNDYDWLLTPPETPLFTSLDDEAPAVNPAQRGRPRSQPISISRSSTMEKSYRSSRGSASPNRLSPSPRSGSSIFQSRGRPSSSSGPNSSPTPSRKPSPPPANKSPTPRRLSTGSNGNSVRGVSPVKTGSRGNSASPKIRAWQSNIPGFSLEAPPNLRTSLADRPASYVRGTSPVSKNGRQSMSPSASRSVNSSHDRDHFSSRSKGSIASSCDDDYESPQSISIGSLDRATARRGCAIPNNRALGLSKKPGKTSPSTSAPKRTFDITMRQMDQRKVQQNMFRPLLSSVPSSTFYAGKTSTPPRAVVSRTSSITTSSNASSDQGTSGLHDHEEVEQNHDEEDDEDVTSVPVQELNHNVLDEVFVFDKADTIHQEEIRDETQDISPNSPQRDIEISEALDVSVDFVDPGGLTTISVCSNCGSRYSILEQVEEADLNLCPNCCKSDIHPGVTSPLSADTSPLKMSEVYDSFDEKESSKVIGQHEEDLKEDHNLYSDPIWNFLPQNSDESVSRENGVQVQDLKNIVTEGAGISVLLNRSYSGKGAVVQSRTFTASSSTISASSSLDLGTRQTDGRFQRQFSAKKSDMENNGSDISMKHRRTMSSSSGASNQTLGLTTSAHREGSETSVDVVCVANQESMASEDSTTVASFSNIDETVSCDSTVDLECSTVEEDSLTKVGEVVEISSHISLDTISEIETEKSNQVSQSGIASPNSNSSADELQEILVLASSDIQESADSDDAHGILEESTVSVRMKGGGSERNMTLEEATETVLFCSSIIQNLAYDAATIAIEKENTDPWEGSKPMVTILGGKENCEKKDINCKTPGKHAVKAQKVKQRRIETTAAARSPIKNNDDVSNNTRTRMVGVPHHHSVDSMKPPKLESKCNCTVM